MNKNTISILGCGWLGFPLAQLFIKNNYQVKGSTRDLTKQPRFVNAGIEPYVFELENPQQDFFKANILIIAVPPNLRRQPLEQHLAAIKSVLKSAVNVELKHIIYTSSTSVYPENNDINKENDFDPNHDLIKIEQAIQDFCSKYGLTCLVLRMGGLMGYDRIPCKYYVGKDNLAGGNKPVNYVHRDDAIQIIYQCIAQVLLEGTYNVVAPIHPIRKAVLTKCAEEQKYTIPSFIDESSTTSKIVEGTKITTLLKYEFLFPDPLNFYYE